MDDRWLAGFVSCEPLERYVGRAQATGFTLAVRRSTSRAEDLEQSRLYRLPAECFFRLSEGGGAVEGEVEAEADVVGDGTDGNAFVGDALVLRSGRAVFEAEGEERRRIRVVHRGQRLLPARA